MQSPENVTNFVNEVKMKDKPFFHPVGRWFEQVLLQTEIVQGI